MVIRIRSGDVLRMGAILGLAAACAGTIDGREPPRPDGPAEPPGNERRRLSHEETLRWIAEHRAWRRARKTRPIWARPVEPGEVGKEFQTADHVKERARRGAWLCAGIAGEPWFQTLEQIQAKYEPGREGSKRFDFDPEPRTYRLFQPRPEALNWAARVEGPGIEGFSIRPGYDPGRSLYSPAGGYVLMREVADPYRHEPDDVWLVQEPLFESTYELIPPNEPKGAKPEGDRPRPKRPPTP